VWTFMTVVAIADPLRNASLVERVRHYHQQYN
jgi:hypothetical protein